MPNPFSMAASVAFLALAAVQTAQAQDAKTVVAKSNAVYKKMKTLQATYETIMTTGPKDQATIITNVKVIAGQKADIEMLPLGKGSGNTGAQIAKMGKQHIVDNGVDAYLYLPDSNQYAKNKHNPNIFPGIMAVNYNLPYAGIDPASKDYKLLAPAKVNGTPVYVLEFQPPAAKGAIKILISIDQATYRFKQSKIMRVSGIGSKITTVKKEVFDGPISASVFQFTPPKNATVLPPPPQLSQPGGAGGAPRR